MNDPEPKPAPLDAFDRLERIHERMKAEQEAWRRLLERLEETKRQRHQRSTPSPSNP